MDDKLEYLLSKFSHINQNMRLFHTEHIYIYFHILGK